MADKYISIREAADYLDVSVSTLRRWENEGRITPCRTAGGQRRYTVKQLDDVLSGNTVKQINTPHLTIGYCRVSTASQKEDLKRQIAVVSHYCEANGYRYKIISDIGSGINYKKKGLNELIQVICSDKCERLVLNYKDRLVRFGYELIEAVCKAHQVHIEIINETSDISYEEELAQDVLSIITAFSAKLYSRRSHQNKEIVATNQKLFHEGTNKNG